MANGMMNAGNGQMVSLPVGISNGGGQNNVNPAEKHTGRIV